MFVNSRQDTFTFSILTAVNQSNNAGMLISTGMGHITGATAKKQKKTNTVKKVTIAQ